MIIGLHGKMGAGKSTVADSLVSVLDMKFNIDSTIKSFATPIYKLISLLFDETVEEIKRNKNTLVRPRSFTGLRSYRELLQNVGMELRDIVNADIWIDALFGRGNQKVLLEWTGGYNWWVIDDLRFINEFYKIKEVGGKLIKVKRDIQNNLKDDILNNQSEIDLDSIPDDEWDLILDNNYSVDILRNNLEKYIMTIL